MKRRQPPALMNTPPRYAVLCAAQSVGGLPAFSQCRCRPHPHASPYPRQGRHVHMHAVRVYAQKQLEHTQRKLKACESELAALRAWLPNCAVYADGVLHGRLAVADALEQQLAHGGGTMVYARRQHPSSHTHADHFPLTTRSTTAELGGKHRRHKKHRRKHRKHRKHHSHAGEGDNDTARISDLSGAKQGGGAATAGDDEEDNKLADEALLSDVRRLLRVRLALRAMVPLPPASQLAHITRASLYPCGCVCRCFTWGRLSRMWRGEPVGIWHTTRL